MVEKLVEALQNIQQRANESGTGEMGYLNTIYDMHALARDALPIAQHLSKKLPKVREALAIMVERFGHTDWDSPNDAAACEYAREALRALTEPTNG